MENIKICTQHKGINSLFYCFDDNKFLCDRCYKEHRKHNLEVISEIEKKEMIYNKLNGKNTMEDLLKEIKLILSELNNDIEQKLNKINNILSFLKNYTFYPNFHNIYGLNYREYEHLEEYLTLVESLNELGNKFNKLKKYKNEKEYINLREINKEVNIIENSNVNMSFSFDIMLGEKSDIHSSIEVPNNNFVIFDLKKNLYLKEIAISVKQNGCVLKNFKVSTKNNSGIWEEVNSFIYKDNKNEEDIQEFPIERGTQYVRIDFIDAWSNEGGNNILIRKLFFKVADIISRK